MEEINNRTLIKGVIREMSILGLPIFIDLEDKSECCYLHLKNDSYSSDMEDSIIEIITETVLGNSVTIRFELDNKMYEANLDRESSFGFKLPSSLRISDKRQIARVVATDVARSNLVAEVRGFGWRRLGMVKDFTESRISVVIEGPFAPIDHEEAVTVRIYRDCREIFHNELAVQTVRFINRRENLLVLAINDEKKDKEIVLKRQHERSEFASTVTLDCVWPDEDGLVITATIVDLGLGGFKARVDEMHMLPPFGSLLTIKGTKILVRLVWSESNLIGCDVRENDQDRYNEWVHMSLSWQNNALAHLPSASIKRKIISTLLRSGYLSGEKAANLNSKASQEIFIDQNTTTSRWLKRYSSSVGYKLDDHISFLKLSDTSWFGQELGNSSIQRGIAGKLIIASMTDFYVKEERFQSLNSVMLGIYQPGITFNQRFWTARAKASGLVEHVTYTGIFTSEVRNKIPASVSDRMQLEYPKPATWRHTYNCLSSLFSEEILAGVGLTRDSFHCPNLTREVFESGFVLKRQVVVLSRDGRPDGVAVLFGLPVFSNLTVTADHLWLVVRSSSELSDWLSVLLKQHDTRRFLNGVTQIIAVCAEPQHVNVESHRVFQWRPYMTLAVPLHELMAFLSSGEEV